MLRKSRNIWLAVAMGKKLFYKQGELWIAAAYEPGSQSMAHNMMDEAALEGVQAFIDKPRRAGPKIQNRSEFFIASTP
jgi:hypothetical protein